MTRIVWQDREFRVRRLVLAEGGPGWVEPAARSVADRLGLDVGKPSDPPQPGDFWLGCYPSCDWAGIAEGEADWASPLELWTALRTLIAAHGEDTAPDAVRTRIHGKIPVAVPIRVEVDEESVPIGREHAHGLSSSDFYV